MRKESRKKKEEWIRLQKKIRRQVLFLYTIELTKICH